MQFDMVVACDQSGGIGIDGKLPWRLRQDQLYFKNVTTSHLQADKKNAVIMGRKTWESIPDKFRPLPDRLNVVLTRNPDLLVPKEVRKASSLDEALTMLEAMPIEKCFVIGGGFLYEEAIRHPACHQLFVTEIEGTFACDTFFPNFKQDFALVSSSDVVTENGLDYTFKVFSRT